MPVHYDFYTPPQIVLGWGRRREVGALAAALGRRALVVGGSRTLAARGVLDEIGEHLRAAGLSSVVLETITREPRVADVDRVLGRIAELPLAAGDFVLAIGGGSAIDLAKAVAALATQSQRAGVQDYLEGVGREFELVADPLPVLAMPTTAGTGTEATKNAVISSDDPPFKKSLRSPRMVPRAVLVDPELGCSLSAKVTTQSGMDALCQLIESYVSRRAQPIPQALALSGIELAAGALARAVHEPDCREAREQMAHAALLSGMALANSGLGMAHGVAAALGVHCHVPHGLACAVMLPVAMQVNLPVRTGALARVGERLTGQHFSNEAEGAQAAVRFVESLCTQVGIPARLSELGVRRKQIPALVTASRGNSMDGNPRPLDDAQLTEILEGML